MWAILATTSHECRFRKLNKVRGQFHNGCLHIIIIDRPTLYIRSTVGSGLLGCHGRPLRLGWFRFISKVRIHFSDGRLRALPICWLSLFICSAVGAGLLGHVRRNLHQFHVPVFIHVHGRFPEIHLLSVLRDGVPNRPPPGSWGRAFLLIREVNPSLRISLRFPPAGGPSPSLAISSSNQSMSSRPSTR